MKTLTSLIGSLSHSRRIGRSSFLWSAVIAVSGLFFLLSFYPQQHRAAVTLAPTDPATLGLSGAVLQLGGGGSVFGSQAALDLSVRIGRSVYVRSIVDRNMHLSQDRDQTEEQTSRWLERNVDVRSLRGGVIQIEMTNKDAVLAKAIVRTYAEALREQLGIIAKNQIAYKRKILEELVRKSSNRYLKAQGEFDSFRRSKQYANPDAGFGQLTARGPIIENQIFEKKRQIENLLKFATPENIQVQRAQADLLILERILAETQSVDQGGKGSVGQIILRTQELAKLQRELDLSRDLYYNYLRTLQQTSVEDLTAAANIRVLEPAYIDPERQVNAAFLAAAILVILLGAAIEFYKLRPRVRNSNRGS